MARTPVTSCAAHCSASLVVRGVVVRGGVVRGVVAVRRQVRGVPAARGEVVVRGVGRGGGYVFYIYPFFQTISNRSEGLRARAVAIGCSVVSR